MHIGTNLMVYVCRFDGECMGTYVVDIGLVPDELEAWNALLVAHHSDIF